MHFQTFTDFLCLGFQKRMKKNRLEFFRNAAEKKVRTNLVPTIDESDSLRNFLNTITITTTIIGYACTGWPQ